MTKPQRKRFLPTFRQALKAPEKPDSINGDDLADDLKALRIAKCSIDDFSMGPVLGTGSFGRVCLARHKSSGAIVAIKSLLKSQIIKNDQIEHVLSERKILMKLSNPFIVKVLSHFQDANCVHFVMEYVAGGEFFTHLRSHRVLSEDVARFYAAQVVLAFEHLHSLHITYRDLKPENMLLDELGNLKMADFGFAKELAPGKRTYTLCGTPDYIAPEIILNKGHGRAVDWWALGILIYEMLIGYPPFCDDDPLGTYHRILKGKITFPSNISPHAKDLIRKLLQIDLSKRYGCLTGGVNDIKGHPWFRNISWSLIKARKVKPPIRPCVQSPDDTSNFQDYKDLPPLQATDHLTEEEQDLFIGF